MKPQALYQHEKAFGCTVVKLGSASERLRLIVFPANEGWITIFRECRHPFEKALPDISSSSAEDAKLVGLRTAICHLHENDHEKARKIFQCEGQMNSMLCRLAREEWEEETLPC